MDHIVGKVGNVYEFIMNDPKIYDVCKKKKNISML